jgi:hypothetical protein
MRVLAQGAEGAVNALSNLPKPLQEGMTLMAGVSGAGLLAATGFVKVKGTVSQFMAELTKMGPTGAKAATALGNLGKVAGKLGIAGLAIGGVIEGFHLLADWANKEAAPTKRNIDALTVSLGDLAMYGRDLNGELTTTFGKGFLGLSADISQIQTATAALGKLQAAQKSASAFQGRGSIYGRLQIADTGASVRQQKSDIGALDTALSQMASNGGLAQANIAFQDLASSQGWTDLQTKQALAQMPKYAAALAGVAAANTGAAQGFGDAAAQVQTLVTSLGDAIAKGETFDSVWNELNGALLNSDTASLAAAKAIDNVTTTLKANKDAWKGNSEAALADRVAIGQAAESAAKAATAKYQETGSVDAANKVYDSYIGQLRKTLLGLGLSKTAVATLLTEYAKMPASVTTTVKAPGLQTANDTASGYYATMHALDGKHVTTTVSTKYTQIGHGPKGIVNRWGGAYEQAAVGALRDATVYRSVSSGARYAFAEPSTGGEAFIPKHGNLGRSRNIADYAVSKWLGGSINWGGHQGAATQAPAVAAHEAAGMSSGQLAQAIRAAMHGVTVVMDSKVVGRIQARNADLLTRGG